MSKPLPPLPPLTDKFRNAPPRLQFDWQEWLPYLEQADATEAEKRELIEALWSIVIAFVDLGWEIGGAIDLDQENGGQPCELKAVLATAVLQSKTQQRENV